MRLGVCLLVLAVVSTGLGVASARADGTATTTTGTTTTGTSATTTTTAPTFAPLSPSFLPSVCVGAGAAALVPAAHPVVALGTPASDLGPSAYATSSGPVLAFGSSTVSGSTCRSDGVTLTSVSLFGGAVTATSVHAIDGKGSATGLEIDGAPVTASTGDTVLVDGWGRLTLGATVGRVRAPLVLRLIRSHDSLAAGTAVAVAFAASAPPVAGHKALHRSRTAHSEQKGSAGTAHARKHGRRPAPPVHPASSFPLLKGTLPPDVRDNPVVSIALRYLGVRYTWGGARPKTGFDCSGLVQYVFAQLGVLLPHFAAAQWDSPDAVWVPPNRLQPGDLVFFTGSDGTRKAPGHVGIYVGDGYLIDAPHTGAVVRIDSFNDRWYAKNYVGARRIVGSALDVRRLFHVVKPSGFPASVSLRFRSSIGLVPVSASLGSGGTGTVAVRAGSAGYDLWAGVGLGALLLLVTGGLAARRPWAARR